MSSIISAIYLWLFSIGLVSNQIWLPLLAISFLILVSWLLRNRGAAGVWLISSASTALVLVSQSWPLNLSADLDFMKSIRGLVGQSVRGVSSDAAALVLGLAVGDDGLVSQSLKQAMQTTSLTHLMAVSGANCAIVIGAVYFALFKFSSKVRVLISTSALLLYVLLVGAQPSVLRAAVMSFAVMLALVLGRKTNPLSALALSVLGILSIAPSMAISYGFALSVLATAGILIVAPKLYERFALRLPKWIAMGLAVSAGAQVFCFPVLLELQGGIPTYGLLANLLCEPLVAPITVLGLMGILLLWIPPVAAIFFWFASLFAWPIAGTANFLAALPFATMPWRLDEWGVIASVVTVATVLLALNSKRVATKNLSWLVLVALLAGSVGVIWNQAVRFSLWPLDRWQVASCDVGQGDATVIRDRDLIAVIDVGRDEKKIDNCLSRLGILKIDLLVLTHYDADHVQGLAGALKGRKVAQAVVTSFVDDRPGANFSQLLLSKFGVPVIKSERGMTGHFDIVKWRVLSPSRDAAEAEDSNDGSVTMLWQFSNFQLITLADLGERGQRRLAADIGVWWTDPGLPLVMKVSHHGSADQYPELIEWLKPKLALISVGAANGYGHPTKRTLGTLAKTGSTILRTDQLGSIAVRNLSGEFEVSYSGSS